MIRLLISILISLVSGISPVKSTKVEYTPLSEDVSDVEDEKKSDDNDALGIGVGVGTSLVVIGGAGATVIQYNKSKRKENEPSSEYSIDDSEK